MPAAVATQTFALTKIQPPRLRAALIERPALERRLGDALAHAQLSLLCAPAGYGKTAALTRQLGQLPPGTAAAWVALDEDDDLHRMASCLLAALEPFDLPWRASPDALVRALQDGGRASRLALATALVNALAGTDLPRGLMLFDDVHRVSDPAVFEFLDLVIDHLPEHWGVVVASRHEPPLALARLRASGGCVEVRQDTLGFDAAEVRALMSLRGANHDDTSVQTLHERTQGWPAGLGLVLSESAAQRHTPAGSLRDRHVFDYLASEVLDEMPAGLRRFLLRCSVLPELDAARCATVSGDAQAALWLEEIERRGLFASVLDSDTFTLRLHDLFRDCLEDRLRRESPEALPDLLRRAASTEPDPVRRIGHLLRAGDWEAATQALATLAMDLLTTGDIKLLLRLHGQFPLEHRQQSPQLHLVRCVAAWAQWDWAPMRDAALAAVDGFTRQGDEAGRRRAQSYACVAWCSIDEDELAQQKVDELLAQPLDDDALSRTLLTDCVLALPRDPARLARSWARLVATLERLDSLPHWYECTPLPGYIGQPGLHGPLWRYVVGVQRRLPEQPIPLSGMVQVTQGWLHLWDQRFQETADTIAQAEADCRWVGQPTNLHWQLHMLKGMAHALQGDLAGARAATQVLLDETQAVADPTRRIAFVARMAHFVQRVAAVAGDEARLRELNTLLDGKRHDPGWFLPPGFRLAADAYIAFGQGRLQEACEAWRTALRNESRIDVYGQAIETRLRLAAAAGLDEAVAVLQPVFARLQAPHEHGMALTAGPQVLQTLAQRRWQGRLAASQEALLVRWAGTAMAVRGGAPAAALPASPPAAAPARDTLSAREREVLERIAAGDSNKLIARAFDLSPHTVKRHVANILDKLGVATRGQAAAWVRDGGSRIAQG